MVDEALRAYAEGKTTLVDAVHGYAASVREAANGSPTSEWWR